MTTKNWDNWLLIKWLGGKYNSIVYRINRRNISSKPPYEVGQVVELKKLRGTRSGQKGEIVEVAESSNRNTCARREAYDRDDQENEAATDRKAKLKRGKGKDNAACSSTFSKVLPRRPMPRLEYDGRHPGG